MEPNIIIKTKEKNSYLYNFNQNRFFLVHPVMDYLLRLSQQGVDLEKWTADLADEGIEIEHNGAFGKEEVLYHYKKYLFFSKNNFFSELKQEEKLDGRITKEQVYSLLSNVRDVVFEVTDACNLKCKYCAFGDYYENYDAREQKKLSLTTAKTLLNYLAKFWHSPLNTSHKIKITISFYGGEPLLNIDFIKEIVRHSKELESPRNTFDFRMTTNGLLIEKHMDFLVENDFGILISLDGNKQHTGYRVFHDGREAYDEIFRNVMALKTKYPEYFKKKIDFNTVFHNKNSISEVYTYFKETFDKIPIVSEISPIGIKHDRKKDFLEMYQNTRESLSLSKNYLSLEREFFAILPGIKVLTNIVNSCSGHCFKDYTELLELNGETKKIPTGTCLPFSRKIFLSVNGKLMPCERIGHQYYFGTVDEEKVRLDAEKVARLANRYFDKIRSKCFTCYKACVCSVCVFNLKADTEQKIENCSGYMDYDSFAGYLASWMSKLEASPEYYTKIMDEVYVS